MSQKTSLNSFPYFDDFDASKNYQKVLFKPGVSVQSRELTTIQSISQNQLESHSNTLFFEGQVISGGELNYISNIDYILLEDIFNGIPVEDYIDNLNGIILVGSETGVKAKVITVLSSDNSNISRNTLYVKYITSNSTNFSENVFRNSEELVTTVDINIGTTTFFANTPILRTFSTNSTGQGSAIQINSGKTYVRGFFVDFPEKLLLLEQYSTNPSSKVGFTISEKIITPLEDSSLNDNARGFSNFSAPGADRLQISCELSKRQLDDLELNNFIEIMRIENGIVKSKNPDKSYNFIQDELARRTADESGDYTVNDFDVEIKETLNDLQNQNGLYFKSEKTYKNNDPSDDLVSISVSPGKAYVKGYEIEKISNTIFEVEKSRSITQKNNESAPINFGKTVIVNNIDGTIDVGVTTYYAELRSRRKDNNYLDGSGEIVGYARLYDSKSLENYENSASDANLYLYDFQFLSNVSLSSTITSYEVGSIVKGEHSGAVGYIRGTDGEDENPTGVATISVYRISGNFVNDEPFTIDGEKDARIIKSVENYDFKDSKSIRIVGSGVTFTSDFKLTDDTSSVGDFNISYNITSESGSISTVTSVDNKFTSVKVDDIIKYNIPGISTSIPTFNRVVSVNSTENLLTISAVDSVDGVCRGALPTSDISVNDISIVSPDLQISKDSGFFAKLPDSLISQVDTDSSSLRIRKQYSITSISNSTFTVNEGDSYLNFLPYSVGRYILIYSDGTHEALNSQKVNTTSNSVTITNLSKSSDTNATLIATLFKSQVLTTDKSIEIAAVEINSSVDLLSGTGNDTINDGLITDADGKYGIRVQDKEICLNYPDVIRINGIFESFDVSTPLVPTLTLTSTNNDLTKSISGELIRGKSSGAVAKVIPSITGQSNTTEKVNFTYLNNIRFKINEEVEFQSSNISGIVNSLTFGSRDVTSNFILDNGQTDDFYDYSKIIRTKLNYVPKRRLLVVFERYVINSSEDLVTCNSYLESNFKNDVQVYNGVRNTDIFDFRPRVSVYEKNSSTYGPFHFLSRKFSNNSSSRIVIDDEIITFNYGHYTPRIDKISLNKNGNLVYKKGISSLNPQSPVTNDDSLELFTLFYPSYVFDVNEIFIDSTNHKRYTMKDLRKIESRVENLEKYTNLSILELEADSLQVFDYESGVGKFKTGILVDNFIDESSQDEKSKYNKVSIDNKSGELRPTTLTTGLDLVWGSKSFIGIGENIDSTVDLRFAEDLESSNLQKTGSVVSLKYDSVSFLEQPFANNSVKINTSDISNYSGNISIYPSSDSWFDVSNYKKISSGTNDPYKYSKEFNENKENSNFYEKRFDSWKDFWVGKSKVEYKKVYGDKSDPYFWKNITEDTKSSNNSQFISLNSEIETQNSKTLDKKIFNRDIIPYLRSRNYAFNCNSLKPSTSFYSFLDKISIQDCIIPKLIEITMISGSFNIGETIVGLNEIENSKLGKTLIKFRAASPNHMDGVYNNPTETYSTNPYTNIDLQKDYSQTSSILNVDLNSLADITDPRYYGYIVENMTLVGETSGAKATVRSIRLISNSNGILQGSFYIKKYTETSKSFLTGNKTFKLSSDEFNSEYSTERISFAETIINSFGYITLNNNNILSLRPNIINKTSDKTNTISGDFNVNNYETNNFINNIVFNNGYANPLSQLFEVKDPSGIFITSVDLYFKSKDIDSPVTMEIKTVRNKIPTSVSIPFSVKTLNPSGITTSTDSSVPTKFTFDSPVFLEGGRIYSLSINSNSNDYEVYSSNYGNNVSPDLVTKSLVNKISGVGELYTSQNVNPYESISQINSSLQSIKFKINKAKFTQKSGALTFYNPDLDYGNNQKPILSNNPLIGISNKKIIGLSEQITNTGIATLGLQLTQSAEDATIGIQRGFLVDTLGVIGVGTTALTVSKVGTGLTPTSGIHTYSNVTFTSLSGKGTGATADVIVNAGSISTITVTNGGSLYKSNEVLSTTIGNTGVDFQFSVGIRTAITAFVVDDIQGKFETGNRIFMRNVSTGSTSNFTLQFDAEDISSYEDDQDGLHFLVNHNRHGMYSTTNKVEISNVISSDALTTLSQEFLFTDITLSMNNSSTDFTKFEGLDVGSNNPGYVKIGNEIISYTSADSTSISGITRGVDSTPVTTHLSGEYIQKYESNGISLRRINKVYTLSSKTTTKDNTMDSYYLKLDLSTNGPDRTGTDPNFDELFFEKSIDFGGSGVQASQNIVFNSITPNIQTFSPGTSNIDCSVRTVRGTSPGGSELSYLDSGYDFISLNDTHNFDNTKMVASRINENEYLDSMIGNKSLSLRLDLQSNDENISPVVDLDRSNVVLVSNNINNPISNYSTNSEVNSLDSDIHECVYLSKKVKLFIESTGIKVILDAYKPVGSNIRVLFTTNNSNDSNKDFELFPGYSNIDKFGNIIDLKNNDGTSDKFINFSTLDEFKTHQFTNLNIDSFTEFSIKIVMTSINSSLVPRIKNLKVLALA